MVIRFDAHAGIHREAPSVPPRAHRLGVFAFEQSAPGERPQETGADLDLHFGDRFGTDTPGCAKAHLLIGIRLKNSLDNDAVEMHVGIEQGAKAVDEGYGANAGG